MALQKIALEENLQREPVDHMLQGLKRLANNLPWNLLGKLNILINRENKHLEDLL